MAGDEVEARLRRLEDHQAVVAVMTRYAWTIDHGPDEEWLDCFTEDGAVEIRYRQGAALSRIAKGTPTADGVRHAGREQLAAFKAGHTRSPGHWHKHMVADTVVELDGDTASAGCYLVRVDETQGVLHVRAFGRYRDRLVRGDDGRWRFVERIVDIEAIDRGANAR